MNKFISVVAVLTLFSSLYVIKEVRSISSYEPPLAPVEVSSHKVEPPQFNIIPEEEPVDLELVQEEIDCLQRNIFWEARNQDELARIAVGWVTINRVKGNRYPNTVCGVVYQARYKDNGVPKRYQCKFSWWCDGKSDEPNLNNKLEREAWEQSGVIADHMVKHCLFNEDISCPEDPTNGAEYYFNPTLANPSWKNTKVKTATVGDHEFYATSVASLNQ